MYALIWVRSWVAGWWPGAAVNDGVCPTTEKANKKQNDRNPVTKKMQQEKMHTKQPVRQDAREKSSAGTAGPHIKLDRSWHGPTDPLGR